MQHNQLAVSARAVAALGVCVLAIIMFTPQRAVAQSAGIGVVVDQPTTTTAPPTTTTTTAPPTTTTTSTTSTTTPPTTAAITTTTSTTETTLPPPPDTIPQITPDPVALAPEKKTGIVNQFKSAARTTKDLVSGVASGKPVADVAEAVLPDNVAQVVVPAVRTASTFVFPIGLAGAVVAFLALQQRIDSSDPKLSAAPLAHNDDVVDFS